MKKILFLLIALAVAIVSVVAQNTYHEDDKEGLRAFLRQPSGVEGEINAQRLSVTLDDTLTWHADELWVPKITGLTWNDSMPKRIIEIDWGNRNYPLFSPYLAGELNMNNWKELTHVICWNNYITSIDASNCRELTELDCQFNSLTALILGDSSKLTYLVCAINNLTAIDVSNAVDLSYFACSQNLIEELDVSNNKKLNYLLCGNNQLTHLDIDTNIRLSALYCDYNHLSLSNLFALQKICEGNYRYLGYQNLPAINVSVGTFLFEEESRFDNIFTEYSVTQNDTVVSADRYTVVNGSIVFHEVGAYSVIMKNTAITSVDFSTSYLATVRVEITVGDVGIDENPNADISVYPNPTTGELRVENGEWRVEDVDFFNIYGQKCHSQHGSILNISHLPAGIYLMKINTDAGVITKKIVKL